MKATTVILYSILLIFAIFELAQAIVCIPSTCDNAKCEENLKCDGKNQVVRKGSCGCCDICYTLLDEGERCLSVFLGLSFFPTSGCKDELRCVNGTCTAITKN